MSGSQSIPPVVIKVDGAEAAARSIDTIVAAAERMAQRTGASAQQMGTLGTVADDVGARLGTLSTRAQAAGSVLERMGAGAAAQGLGTLSTVLDAVALASSRVSANALVAETGVSSLFARFATGATVIGAVVAGLQAAGLGIRNAGEATVSAKTASDGYQQSLASLNTFLLSTEERADRAARALMLVARNASLANAESSMGANMNRRSEAMTEAARLEREVAEAERRLAAANQQLAGPQSPFPAFAGTTRAAAEARRDAAQRDLDRLRADLASRQQEYQRLTGEIETTGRIIQQVQQVIYAAPIGPERPSRTGGGGTRLPDPDLQEAWLAVQEQGRDREAADRREAAEWDQEQQRREDEEKRRLERREDRNNRVTDRIVDYSAERFAELFDKNGRGWEGMLETLERTAKSTIARIAAELVLRPIIAPVVSALGLGALGTGNGGFSGIGGLTGGGGGTGSAIADAYLAQSGGGGIGGLGQLVSLGRTAYSAFGGSGSGGGWLGGVGGIVSNPIWTSGGGWFGAGAVSSGGFLPAGATSLPAMSSATTGVGGIGGTLGSVSLGTYAAGIGLGYMGGSLLGRYVAGNSPARQQNAQIGAGAGAVSGALAGAAIGSVIPIIGTAAGALIGGIVGGTGGGGVGGLIGPGRGFSGGDVGIGVGADGLLTVTGAGGKRFDSAAATEQTQQQLAQINAALRAGGVTIGGMGTGTLGWQGFGQSGNVFGPTEIFNRVRGNLSSTNANLQQVLAGGRVNSFEELGQTAQFITAIYEPLSKARDYTKEYADAIGAQLQIYDQAIARARELGLAEQGLVAARAAAQASLLEERNRGVFTSAESLRVRELRLAGDPASMRQAALLEFSLGAGNERNNLRNFLRDSGVGDETALFQDTMARFERVIRGERTRFRDDFDANAGGSGRSFMEDLTVGGLGGLAPSARYAAGLRVLADARASGNLDRITAAARSVLPVARDYLGTSERFGALTADIARDVRRAGGDPVGLGVFLEGQAAGNQALERIYGLSNSQLAELKGMRAEITRLNAVLTTLMQRR